MLSTGNTSTLTISQLISIPSVNSSPLVKSHIKSSVNNFTHQSTHQSVNSSTSKFTNQSSRPSANSSSSQVIHQIIRPSTKSSINHPLKRSFADSVPTATTGVPSRGAPLLPIASLEQTLHDVDGRATFSGALWDCGPNWAAQIGLDLLWWTDQCDSNLRTTFRPSF